MTYLQAALALIQIVNWVMGKMDDAKKAQALAALWTQEFMRQDKEILDRANNLRRDAERQLADNPDGVRTPDQFERPGP